MAVTWGDPPPVVPHSYGPLLAEVMERPGEWAMIRVFTFARQAHEAANYLRKPICPKPPGRWAFAVRQMSSSDPRRGVWAKWEEG